MSNKIEAYKHGPQSVSPEAVVYAFECPGCGHDHGFTVGPGLGPRWSWNGSLTAPTFAPSLLSNKDIPENRCHLFMTDGKIQFLADYHHALAGKTVELPDRE